MIVFTLFKGKKGSVNILCEHICKFNNSIYNINQKSDFKNNLKLKKCQNPKVTPRKNRPENIISNESTVNESQNQQKCENGTIYLNIYKKEAKNISVKSAKKAPKCLHKCQPTKVNVANKNDIKSMKHVSLLSSCRLHNTPMNDTANDTGSKHDNRVWSVMWKPETAGPCRHGGDGRPCDADGGVGLHCSSALSHLGHENKVQRRRIDRVLYPREQERLVLDVTVSFDVRNTAEIKNKDSIKIKIKYSVQSSLKVHYYYDFMSIVIKLSNNIHVNPGPNDFLRIKTT